MASTAILIWPIIALILFRRLDAVSALIWGILIPYLFLPERFSIALPALPDLDKTNVIATGVILGFLANKQKFLDELTHNPIAIGNHRIRLFEIVCLVLFFAGTIITVLTNGDVLRYGSKVLPAMRPWDSISQVGAALLYFTPFLFARKYLARPEAHRMLLSAFVAMALIYSIFMLIEIRLSPQLHHWVYGYHQNSFLQHIRDGFRPMVFLKHGLWVGFFMFMATIAAFSLWRATQDSKWLLKALWIFLVLALSENLAALLIAILGLIVLFGLGQRGQMIFAFTIALTILFYPMLRQAKLIPINQITDAAAVISQERADSLKFRLDHEDTLLEKALERPVAGWGGYSRERVYNAAGKDVTISEGRWIQTISTRGWIGYIGLFGLLTLPVLFLLNTRRRKSVPVETLGLAIIIIGNLIYMIPNSTLTAIGWLVFGALAGFVQYDSQQQTAPAAKPVSRVARNQYTRFPVRHGPNVRSRNT